MVAFASSQRKQESYDFRLLEKLTFVRVQADSCETTRQPPAAQSRTGNANTPPGSRRFEHPGGR